MVSRITCWHCGYAAAASMAVRLVSLRLPACPSLDGMASLDLGSAEYCRSRRTFAAEFICMAMKIGSLFPSSRLDGLALLCSKSSTASSSSMRSASHSGETSGSPKSCGEQHAQISAWIVLGRICSRCTPSPWRLCIARTRGLTSSSPDLESLEPGPSSGFPATKLPKVPLDHYDVALLSPAGGWSPSGQLFFVEAYRLSGFHFLHNPPGRPCHTGKTDGPVI